jgi:DNA-binding CsgD family transcriptional regulator
MTFTLLGKTCIGNNALVRKPCKHRRKYAMGRQTNDSSGHYGLKNMDNATIQRLTERQKDCLRLVAQGYTSKEIGRALDLSPSTVDNHILTAVQSMSAHSRGAAARSLTGLEARQKLPRESRALAESAQSGLLSVSAEAPVLTIRDRKIWTLPPIGGQKNELDSAERLLRIVQVAVVGFGTVMSLTLLIAGVFKIFS